MGLIEDACRRVEQLIRSGSLAEAICEDLALIVRRRRGADRARNYCTDGAPWPARGSRFPTPEWGGGPRQVGAQPFLVVVP
jgi:hypothetical protein